MLKRTNCFNTTFKHRLMRGGRDIERNIFIWKLKEGCALKRGNRVLFIFSRFRISLWHPSTKIESIYPWYVPFDIHMYTLSSTVMVVIQRCLMYFTGSICQSCTLGIPYLFDRSEYPFTINRINLSICIFHLSSRGSVFTFGIQRLPWPIYSPSIHDMFHLTYIFTLVFNCDLCNSKVSYIYHRVHLSFKAWGCSLGIPYISLLIQCTLSQRINLSICIFHSSCRGSVFPFGIQRLPWPT